MWNFFVFMCVEWEVLSECIERMRECLLEVKIYIEIGL